VSCDCFTSHGGATRDRSVQRISRLPWLASKASSSGGYQHLPFNRCCLSCFLYCTCMYCSKTASHSSAVLHASYMHRSASRNASPNLIIGLFCRECWPGSSSGSLLPGEELSLYCTKRIHYCTNCFVLHQLFCTAPTVLCCIKYLHCI
jgi:hypothetical protein